MMTDNELKTSVLAELKWEPNLNAAHIGVTAKNGIVALAGHVENYAEKYAAETAVTRVKGVKAIAQELDVRLPFAFERSDEDIAVAAIDKLSWNVYVPRDAVKLKVEKGWVTLTGQVDRHIKHDAASRDIRQLFGVVGLSNNITIKPQINIAGLSSDITAALERIWFFNTDAVHVTAAGNGRVKVTGSVDT